MQVQAEPTGLAAGPRIPEVTMVAARLGRLGACLGPAGPPPWAPPRHRPQRHQRRHRVTASRHQAGTGTRQGGVRVRRGVNGRHPGTTRAMKTPPDWAGTRQPTAHQHKHSTRYAPTRLTPGTGTATDTGTGNNSSSCCTLLLDKKAVTKHCRHVRWTSGTRPDGPHWRRRTRRVGVEEGRPRRRRPTRASSAGPAPGDVPTTLYTRRA